MAHIDQKIFFEKVKKENPEHFEGVKVIDCGSLDINGSLKDLFTDSDYTGVDIVPGKNVDIVSAIKDSDLNDFDTVVSGEMLEHDETWKESLKKMYEMTRPGGLLAISCAGEGRPEHGTTKTTGSHRIWGTSPDYYKNLNEEDFREVYKEKMFNEMHFEYNPNAHDTYFWGIKVLK